MEEATSGARRRWAASEDGRKEGEEAQRSVAAAEFIYHNSAIALPVADSQCKCWTFREKITSPGGKRADGQKLSRLQ